MTKQNSAIFKTINGDLTVFNKTLISTKNNLKALETVNATAYNKNGTFNLQGLSVNTSQSVSNFTKLNNAFKVYNDNLSKSTQLQNAYIQAVGKQNISLGNYLAGLNGGKASLLSYGISLVGATLKTVALQIATIALNSAITMGASLIISGIVSAISAWIHKTENMISTSEEAIEKIKAINDELKENQKFISDSGKRYAELAQGVNQLTGENISLNKEDYEEFLTLSNQLAEMFPTLTRNYNDNGDAIVQLTGNVDTIVGSLQNLIEAEKDLTNKEISDKLPQTFKGINAKSEQYKSELEDLENKKNALLQGLENFTSKGLSQKIQTGLTEKYFEIASNDAEEYCRLVDDYTKLLKEANLEYSINNFDPLWNGKYDNDGNQIFTYKTSIYIESSDADITQAQNTIDNKIQELANQYEIDIKKLNEEIIAINEKNKANWTSLSSSIFAWLSTDDSFKIMDDTVQATVQNIVNNLDWGNLNFSSWENAKQYIQDNILSLFHTSEGKETLADIEAMFGIQTQFNCNNISVEQYQQKLQDFLNSINNLPPETKKSVLLLFGIQTDDDGKTSSDVETMVENVKKKLKGTKFDDKVGTLSLEDLKIADNLEVDDNTIQSWDELMKLIKEVKVKNLKPLSYTEQLSQIQSLSKGLDQLDKIYSDVKNKGDFDWSSILNNEEFKATFGKLGDVYENFIQTISNSPTDISTCQSAFNNLATEWINSTGILDNVTEENEKLTASMLKQMGIANADELAHYGLEKAKAKSFIQSKANTAITYDNIDSLISQANAAGISTNAYLELLTKEVLFNNNGLDTSDKCEQILAIGKAAGVSSMTIAALNAEIDNVASQKLGSGERTRYAESKGVKVIYEKDRTDKNAKGNGNLYVVGGKEIDDFREAMQYAEAYNTMQNIASAYNTVDFSGSVSSGGGSAPAATETKETFNWIETALSRIQRTITNFGKTVSATWRSWTDRNKALKDQVSAVTQEINLQEQAYNRYMALANGTGLSEPYRSLVENGAIDISTISNESLAEQIKEFQDYYEKALACKDAVSDLNDELANLVQTEFDHTAKRYDDELSMHEHQSKMLQSSADILETKGYMVSSDIYDALARQEEEKITALQNKYASLESVLSSSNIPKYSEQWYEMQLEIAGVAEELQNSQKNLAEYNNTLREIDWELFDKLQDKISGVKTESDFLIELLSSKKMFNDDGSITEHGQATLGLHAVNYNTYMAKADEYATELEQINAELANDPYNQTLLDRRDELLEQQWDMILAAEKEKQTMKDLKSEGYDVLLNSMSSIIDKRKEMFSQMKDLSDYEKSISEQTAEVSKYQKLIDSMQGMADTEEGRATLQKYEVSLKEAKENLEETEYERYLKDQEQLLDSLYDQTEEWVNSRLDDLDGLIHGVIESTNANATEIKTTLEAEAGSVGATLSTEMENLWSTNGAFTSVVSTYGSQQLTTLQEILATMKEYFSDMKKDAEDKAKEEIASSSPAATPQPAPVASPQSSPANTSSGNALWGSWFISKRDTYSKSKLNTETSVVDRLKYRDIDSSKDAREKYYYAMGGSGVYVGSPQQNQWMLTQMKTHGFTEGGTIGKLIRSSGEDGFILAKTGEEILSLEKIRALGESFALIDPVINSMPRLENSMDMYKFQPEKTPHVDIGDIHFDLPNVHNADEFITELQHSNRFEKIIKEITYGGMLGKNRYNKFKY